MPISIAITCKPATAGREVDGNIAITNTGLVTATITSAPLLELNGAVPVIRQPVIPSPATIATGVTMNLPFAFVTQAPVISGAPSQNVGANHASPYGNPILTLQCTVSGTDSNGAVADTAQCSVAVGALQSLSPSAGGAMQFSGPSNTPNLILL